MKNWCLIKMAISKKTEFVVEGRKQPLEEIRKKTLKLHEKFMRVKPDEFYNEMPREQLVSRLTELNEYDENDGLTKMRKKPKKMECTRHLPIWHDHSTLANNGHIHSDYTGKECCSCPWSYSRCSPFWQGKKWIQEASKWHTFTKSLNWSTFRLAFWKS